MFLYEIDKNAEPTKKLIHFNELKDGNKYEVSFENTDISQTSVEDFQKQVGDWKNFTENDIFVYTEEEILKYKENKANEQIVFSKILIFII